MKRKVCNGHRTGSLSNITWLLLLLTNCFSSGGCCTDITPRERVITNGQRSLGLVLLLQLSGTFLKILAVPNKAVFCSKPVLIPSLSSNVSNLLLTKPGVPTTTGTTSTRQIPHNFLISPFRSWYFSTFSLYYYYY